MSLDNPKAYISERPLMYELSMGILGSLVAAILFVVFFNELAERIRDRLKRARAGYFRRRYVKIFVDAVRGEHRIRDAALLIRLQWLFPLSAIVVSFIIAMRFVDDEAHVNAAVVRSAAVLGQISQMTKPSEFANGEQSKETDLRENLRQLREVKSDLSVRIAVCQFISIAAFFWIIGIAASMPRYLFIARFGHEIERFTLRIQGLASKSELSQLTEKELLVRDEQSAKEFVEAMAKIADRHNVGSLVDSFLLWGKPITESADHTI